MNDFNENNDRYLSITGRRFISTLFWELPLLTGFSIIKMYILYMWYIIMCLYVYILDTFSIRNVWVDIWRELPSVCVSSITFCLGLLHPHHKTLSASSPPWFLCLLSSGWPLGILVILIHCPILWIFLSHLPLFNLSFFPLPVGHALWRARIKNDNDLLSD